MAVLSRVTDKILPIVKEWQERPLEEIYAVVFLYAIHYHVRNEGRIVKRTVYIVIGIDMEDILIGCVDGLTGFHQAIETVFTDTEI